MKKMFLFSFVLLLLSGYTKSPIEIPPWPYQDVERENFVDDFNENPRLIPYEKYKEFESERISLPEFPFKKAEGIRASVDTHLIPAQSPVKNQGSRGQCHNFSVTAALEYSLWAGEKEANDFSEQCNAWKFHLECPGCAGNPDSNDDGGYAAREIMFVKDKFMKFEKDFKYKDNDPTKCRQEFNNQPYKQFQKIDAYSLSFDEMKRAIQENFVIIGEFYWYENGWNTNGEFDYKDQYQDCSPQECGGHAILIVGYDDDYFGAGKGGFIFKNSWGKSWGWSKGSKPAGYGVMPYPYARQFEMRLTAASHRNAYVNPFPDDGGGCSNNLYQTNNESY